MYVSRTEVKTVLDHSRPTLIRRIFSGLVATLSMCLVLACTTPSVTFNTTGKAKVSAVGYNDLDEVGVLLGETPVTVALDKLVGKAIRVTQDGKQPLYWIVTDIAGDDVQLKMKLLDAPVKAELAKGGQSGDSAKTADSKAATNRVVRLMLKAYQALSGRHFDLAGQLAAQAMAIDPELAGPQVIAGIAAMQLGDKVRARGALAKASALDPGDADISTLLRAVE